MVEATPMSEAELANQPQGQSQPGRGSPWPAKPQSDTSPGLPVPPAGRRPTSIRPMVSALATRMASSSSHRECPS